MCKRDRFYLPNRPAELIRDLREVMEFYFSLSIKEVDASIFPEALVRALGEVIHYPVQHVDVARLVEDHRTVSYTHLRAHETVLDLVCRLLLEKKKILHLLPAPSSGSISPRLNLPG
eukprot:TRINITY_DN14496_c0_g1_i1.p1 TRINITY_DN14496_c0_g1~~TRINITY_DN14496_c0_g1_i1.p1  ORF type:complete len:131 (+),score=23.71 TRINITY_DN14496_c0_g1_i1:44-394(+)